MSRKHLTLSISRGEVLVALQACGPDSLARLAGGCHSAPSCPSWRSAPHLCCSRSLCHPSSTISTPLPTVWLNLSFRNKFRLQKVYQRSAEGPKHPSPSFLSYQHPASSLGNYRNWEINLGTVLLTNVQNTEFTDFSTSLLFLCQDPIQDPVLPLVSS